MSHNVLTRYVPTRKGVGRRRNLLGMPSQNIHDTVQRVQAGFSFSSLLTFEKSSGLPLATIANLIQIPPRTLARRRASGRLQPQESERLLRIATVFERAVALFEGDVDGARRWLTRPVRALGYEKPLVYAQTEVGAREVERVIDRLEHGIFM